MNFSLPLTALVVFLSAAVFCDLRWRKVPNKLVLAGLALGLLIAAVDGGLPEVGGSLLGAAAGFGLLLPLYAVATLGAGDVKFMAAAGAFLPLDGVLWAVIGGIALNGVLGLAVMLFAGDLPRAMRRYYLMLVTTLTLKKRHYIPPEADEAAARRMPYVIGLALATGVVAAGYHQSINIPLIGALT